MNGDAWIQTYTGGKFYFMHPEKSRYNIRDIAHALSNICRFVGHGAFFESVAQHSIIMSNLVAPQHAMWGLLHDASEAYIMDIASPLKRLPAFKEYKKLEQRTMTAICKTFGLREPEPPEVRVMDNLLLRNEAKCLGLLSREWSHYSLCDLGLDIRPMSPKFAEEQFLKRFVEIQR